MNQKLLLSYGFFTINAPVPDKIVNYDKSSSFGNGHDLQEYWR